MIEFKRILCPVDLSDFSARPLAYADAIARWYGGHVTAFHATPVPMPVLYPDGSLVNPMPFVPMSRDTLMPLLHEKIAAAGVEGPEVTAVIDQGEPARAILDQARTLPADLIVIGTHGLSGFDRFLLGSVTEKVLHKAPCPVLTVPPHAPATPSRPPALRRILAAVDFSAASIESLSYGFDIAERSGASVLALYSVESLAEEEPRENAHYNVSEFRGYVVEEANKRLADIVRHGRGGNSSPPTTEMVVIGRAHREILRVASEQDVDLIVMGAQGRGGAALALFGSTTQQIVRGASCAVLTVR